MAIYSNHNQGNHDPVVRSDLHLRPSDKMELNEGQSAGFELLKLVDRILKIANGALVNYEKEALEEIFEKGEASNNFTDSHIKAIQSAIQTFNPHLIRFLLKKALSKQVLVGELTILQSALCAWKERKHWYFEKCKNWPYQEPLTTIQLLIDNGAPVDTLNEAGYTPLYYACKQGLQAVFQVLVAAGADHKRDYHELLIREDCPPSVVGSTPTPLVKNSLQVSMDGLQLAMDRPNLETSFKWLHNSGVYRRWEPIVLFLINAGVTAFLNDQGLTTFLEGACFEGKLDVIEKLLKDGVFSDVGRGLVGKFADRLMPGLRAATLQGHRDVIVYLLRYGASASAKHQFGFGDEDGEPMTTIASLWLPVMMPRLESKKLDGCEILFNAGIDAEDQGLLLEKAAIHGRLDLANRLLASQGKIAKVPLNDSLAMIETLCRHSNSTIDSAAFQDYAFKIGSVEIMRWLVAKGGPCLPTDKEF